MRKGSKRVKAKGSVVRLEMGRLTVVVCGATVVENDEMIDKTGASTPV
jgi:hypothetical protein